MSSTLVKSVRALAFLGGLALTLTGECQTVFLGVFFGFFIMGIKIDDFPSLSKFFSAAQPYLAVFILLIAFIDFFYLSNSFLLTVAHFLLSVQGVRLLALRTHRESFGSILLSSLSILSAATLSVDWTYFFMLFVYLGGVIWTLILLTILEESKQDGTQNSIMQGSFVWRDLMPVLRKSALSAFVIAVGCCATVFVFFPRFNFQGFRGQFLQPVRKTGFTSQVDLSNTGKLFEDNTIVMRVEINPSEKALWSGYLRGRTLEKFDGKIWAKMPSRSQQIFHTGQGKYQLLKRHLKHQATLHQRVFLESMDSPLLFLPSQPIALNIDRPMLELYADGAIQRRNGDSWRVRYEAESIPSLLDPKYGDIARSVPHKVDFFGKKTSTLSDEFLTFPKNLGPLIQNLSTQMIGPKKTAYQKAKLVEKYFQEKYSYSLEARKNIDGKTPLEDFLIFSKKGHCEYFATAMVLLLRFQGVPARMATGFLSQEWNSKGNYFIVRMKHAHAWVEAYIPGTGWVGFDPSPRSDVIDTSGDFLSKWSETMDYINLRWNHYILSYDFERQVDIFRAVTGGSNQISFKLTNWFSMPNLFHAPRGPAGTLKLAFTQPFWMMGAVLIFGFAVIIWRWIRFKQSERVWFYRPFLRKLESRFGKKAATQTMQEYLDEISTKLGEKRKPVCFLNSAYYRARFNPDSHLSPLENRVIRKTLRDL